MNIKELFSVILKVLGIFFLKDIIIALPSFFGVFISFFGNDIEGTIITSVLSLASIGIYCAIIYLLIFKTNWVISKLKLTDDFAETPLQINLHRSTVVSIAIIFTGIFIITQSVPGIIRETVEFIKYRRETRGLLNIGRPFEYAWFVAQVAEFIIGLILVGYHKYIGNFIEHRRKK